MSLGSTLRPGGQTRRRKVNPDASIDGDDDLLAQTFNYTCRSVYSEAAGGHIEFTETDLNYFKKMFDLFDTDKSGSIGFHEMKNLCKHLGVEMDDKLLKQSMDDIDENGNGDLEFDEFVQWLQNAQTAGQDDFAMLKSKIRAQGTKPLSNQQIEQFRAVFDHFDTDKSGSIDIDELKVVFSAMGQELSDDELQGLMNQVDDDGSGEMEFAEFLLLMCSNFGDTKSFDSTLLEEFHCRDPSKSGLIKVGELTRMIKEMVGSNMTDDEIREVAEVACEREDGFIEYMKWDALWDACRNE